MEILSEFQIWSDFEKRIDRSRVELFPGLLTDAGVCHLFRPGGAIRQVADQGIPDIHHGKDARG